MSFIFHHNPCCCCLFTKSGPTLCHPMDYRPPGFSVHGISQARILEWVAISYFRRYSRPRDHVSCVGRQILYHWATRETHYPLKILLSQTHFSHPGFPCTRLSILCWVLLSLIQDDSHSSQLLSLITFNTVREFVDNISEFLTLLNRMGSFF
mgnify:CR=1 FL=1